MPSRIEDYALIGDCNAAALVAPRRLDRLAVLAALRFRCLLCGAARQQRAWPLVDRAATTAKPASRAATGATRLILETRFECRDGAVTLVDFMPMGGSHSHVVRLVIGERGRVAMRTELILRFGYGAIVPWVEKLEDETLRAIAGPDMVVLRTPVALVGRHLTTWRRIHGCGRRAGAVRLDLRAVAFAAARPARRRGGGSAATEAFWNEWAARCRPAGRWSDAVVRSVMTLKALTYAPTGGIVAAPTTSLPEQLGGTRNWDYRFCWLRDATFTLLALDERRLLRGGAGVARLAGAGGRRQPAAGADPLRHRGRAAHHRMGGAVAARIRGIGAGAHRQQGA